MKNTSSKDYNTLKIFQLLAKVVSSQSVSLQQGFLQNFEILKYILENYIYIYIPCRPLITLYMVPYVYLNSTYTLQLT